MSILRYAQRVFRLGLPQLRIIAVAVTQRIDSPGRDHYGRCVRSHRHQFRVIYGDTDMMGVVYYGNYFRYFEAGRSEFLRAAGLPYGAFETAGYMLPITSASAKYRASARYDDLLTLETTVSAVKMASLQMTYRLVREADDSLIATGETVHACVDRSGRVTRIPPMLREKLEA